MSPADELRAAAAQLEELAAGATPGPWTADHELITAPSGTGSAAPTLITEVVGSAFEGGGVAREADSAWIAAMSPPLAAPLSRWLDEQAERAEMIAHAHGWQVADSNATRNALEIARIINGTTS